MNPSKEEELSFESALFFFGPRKEKHINPHQLFYSKKWWESCEGCLSVKEMWSSDKAYRQK